MHIVTNSDAVRGLLSPQHSVYQVTDEELLEDYYDPDQFWLAIVDIDSVGGVAMARGFKSSHPRLGLIGLTGSSTDIDCLLTQSAIFMDNGGNYLLPRNASREVLVACLGVLRHAWDAYFSDVKLCKGRLVINPKFRTVYFDGQKIYFTHHEMVVICGLASQVGRTVAWDDLKISLYGPNGDDHDSNTLNVFVCRIRKRLRSLHPKLAECLVTNRVFGYQLIDVDLDA